VLADQAQRKRINVFKDGAQESLLVFSDADPISGELTLRLDPGKRVEHLGVKVRPLPRKVAAQGQRRGSAGAAQGQPGRQRARPEARAPAAYFH
jgi:hypothetical protein